MESSVNGVARAILVVLALLWASAWILADASNGNWLLTDVCCALPLFVSTTLSLVPIVVAALVYVAARLFRRRLSTADCVPIFVVAAGLLLGWALPSKPAAMFWVHRGEFLELAEWAVDECDDSWWDIPLPAISPFDHARVNCRADGLVVIEFEMGNFYLAQLVFISTDSPDDALMCSGAGMLDRRLEPQWYVCSRNWD